MNTLQNYKYEIGEEFVWYKHGFKCKIVARFNLGDLNRYVIEFTKLPSVFTLSMLTKEDITINYECQSLVAGEKFLEEEFRAI